MSIQTALDPVADLLDEAKRVLPGGSFGNMPAEVILRAGKGGRIWDENGKEYVDFLLGSEVHDIMQNEGYASPSDKLPHAPGHASERPADLAKSSAAAEKPAGVEKQPSVKVPRESEDSVRPPRGGRSGVTQK